jgi:hypothetical protein
MAVTARIPLQLEPAEKRIVARKAKALGLSVNDYVRNAIRSFQPEQLQEREIDAVLRQALASAARAEKALDQALAAIAASERRLKRLERGGRKVRAA